MILANINDAAKYCAINPHFEAVFDFLRSMSAASTEGVVADGYRVNFSGKYVDTSDTNPDGTDKVFEAHRDYIDIHYCISGSEGIGVNNVTRLTPITDYDAENDYFLLTGEYQKVILHEGDFCVVFPEDAHIPMMRGDTDAPLLKAVVKVKVKE